jgi:hypothetical protein
MNITNAKTPCPPPAGMRNRPFKWFLPAVAGTWLLLAEVGVSIGGCLEDTWHLPGLNELFKSIPSFHHCRNNISGTLCAPCYGYHPTCWRQWPNCCAGCPSPPVPVSAESPEVQPKLPPPEVTPTPEGVPLPTQQPVPSLPGAKSAVPSVPTTAPQLQRPADSTPLSPTPIRSAVPRIVPRVGILWALPSNPQATRLRDSPKPPRVQVNAVLMSDTLRTRSASPGEDLDIAPMPPELPKMAQYPLAPMPGR